MKILAVLLLASSALAQSTPPKIFLPAHASGLPTTNGAADALFCVTAPAEFSLSNLTKLAIGTIAASQGTVVGAAIYPNSDAGTAIAQMSVTLGATSGPVGQTGLTAYSVTGGTLYRFCVCASVGSVTNLFLGVQYGTTCCEDKGLPQLVQAFHPTFVGTAANSCTIGVTPSSTGAIAPDTTSPGRNTQRLPILLSEQ